MQVRDFNHGWFFSEDNGNMMSDLAGILEQKKPVTIPHDAMIGSKRAAGNPGGNGLGFFPGGNYIYTKKFFVSREDEAKSILLEFGGVYKDASVFLNHEFVTGNANGYTQFYADLTDHLNYGGENELIVRVKNADQPNSRWYSGSGIYRPVWMLVGDLVYIRENGLKITTPEAAEDISLAETEIHLKSRNASRKKLSVFTEIKDAQKRTVCTERTPVTLDGFGEMIIRQRLYIRGARLWSPEEPDLYTCHVSIQEGDKIWDETVETFGIRHIQIDPMYGLRINGKVVKLRGACIHHDLGVIGSASLAPVEERRVRLLKEAGFNAVRMAHNPSSRELLDACDRVGMLLMEESYDMWNESKNPYDYAGQFADCWERDIESIVERDFNHPCVLMYSVGNEIGEINRPAGAGINRRLAEKIRSLDPTRFVTNAVNGMVVTMADLEGVMQDLELIPKTAGGGINDVMTNLMGQMNQIGRHPSVAEVLDETFSALDLSGYNYMYGRYEMDAENYPNRVYYGSETLPRDIDVNWDYAGRLPQMIGDFTWTGWDYIGEAGVGVPSYEGPGGFFSPYPVYLANVGDIDITGFRRPMSYYREIVFGLRKEPYLAIQTPGHFGQTLIATPWASSDAIESWTWPGYEGRPAVVEVYSRAKEVELFVNGKSLGRKPAGKAHRYKAFFETIYEPGELKAVNCEDEECTGEYKRRTAGKELVLQAEADRMELKAGGMDAVCVSIAISDAEGNVHTDYRGKVSIAAEGAGTLAGFGSADPWSTENFFDTERTPYNGRLLAVIRSGDEPGEITVNLKADGCGEKQIVLACR